MPLPNELFIKHKWLSQSILTAYRGSIAHGTYVPNKDPNSIDDKDLMAVVIPNIECYFGLNQFGSRGTKEFFEPDREKINDLAKTLLMKHFKFKIDGAI